MKLAERRFTGLNRSSTVQFRFFFDIHYGNKNCDVEQLLKDIEYVKNTPNCFWFFGGDVVDAINISDKRKDLSQMALNYRAIHKAKQGEKEQDRIDMHLDLDNIIIQSIEDIERMFGPIKDRCLGILRGNHENMVKKTYHLDCTYEIARRMGPQCEILEYTCLYRMRFDRSTSNKNTTKKIDWYMGHGDGSGATIGAKINRIVKKGETLEADIYIMGHNHGLVAANLPRLSLNHLGNLRLIAHKKLYCLGGTYLKTFGEGESGYGEIAGYSATPIGSLLFEVKPFNEMREGKSMIDLAPDYRLLNIGEAVYGSTPEQ